MKQAARQNSKPIAKKLVYFVLSVATALITEKKDKDYWKKRQGML